MNMALAADEAARGYGKNINVEDAMQVLADAGYNSDNWVCLTAGYQVYWYEEDNRCILYNSNTAEIEYPEEYIGAKTKDGKQNIMLSPYVHVYNENHLKAQQFNMSLSSSLTYEGGKISSVGISGSGSNATYSISSTTTNMSGATLSSSTASSSNNLKALASEDAQAIIKSSLGVDEADLSSTNVYMYATKESISADVSGAYASLQISAVGTTPTLTNSGEVKENLYYLSIVNTGGASAEQIAAAQKAAAQYIYNIFDQITEDKIDDNVTILIAPDTEIDCSLGGADWAPCKTFTGYFGTTDAAHPIVINGANLTSKTGYAQTVQFTGSTSGEGNSRYFVTGFFGTIYGTTTIENVTFKNLVINEPAHDYVITDKADSRNTIAVIGGIVDCGDNTKPNSYAANIVLKNIKVESSCSITGFASAGGLVGYIGSAGDGRPSLNGEIHIENCIVECDVTSTATKTATNYNPVGGIIGFSTRVASTLKVDVKNCTYKGKLTGRTAIGTVCGDVLTAMDITVDGGTYNAVTYGENANPERIAEIACSTQGAAVVKGVTIKNNPAVKGDYAPLVKATTSNSEHFKADGSDWE